MYYACAVNTERNSITTSIFKDYINITHPKEEGNFDLTEVPKNAVIIESAIFDKKNERCSASFETKVYSKCGDADVMTSRNKHIDPALKFYNGVPLMITSNTNLKKGLDNGARITGLSIQIKK